MQPPRLWTFGHSTRTAEQTVQLLRHNGIDRVVDVRSVPGSRRCPWFGAEAMSGWLAEAGVEYSRIGELGGRRGRQPVEPEVNAGWSNDSFHRYADWTLSADFEHGLAELSQLADARTAIMCSEAVPWRCHRSLISSVLTARGWQVEHILDADSVLLHRLGQWGAEPDVHLDGTVTYPRRGTPPLFD
jgi:uncharacterized protein (DUF488 family)